MLPRHVFFLCLLVCCLGCFPTQIERPQLMLSPPNDLRWHVWPRGTHSRDWSTPDYPPAFIHPPQNIPPDPDPLPATSPPIETGQTIYFALPLPPEEVFRPRPNYFPRLRATVIRVITFPSRLVNRDCPTPDSPNPRSI